jgi:hypothetical protein
MACSLDSRLLIGTHEIFVLRHLSRVATFFFMRASLFWGFKRRPTPLATRRLCVSSAQMLPTKSVRVIGIDHGDDLLESIDIFTTAAGI